MTKPGIPEKQSTDQLKKGLFKECQLPCNSNHLLEHDIQVPTNKEILQLMEDGTNDLRNTEKSGNKI